jgi:SAM-dependent methyltransferase
MGNSFLGPELHSFGLRLQYFHKRVPIMKSPRGKRWNAENILALGRSYQVAAVLAAAADLDLFDLLAKGPLTARDMARKRHCALRGMTILLDALAALELLRKTGESYALLPGSDAFLTSTGAQSVIRMLQHQSNCLRKWSQLAKAVKDGRPIESQPSVRGVKGDCAAFIGGMHNLGAPVADRILRLVRPLRFRKLLDVGGGSGTWTMAFLRACPSATAILFDLPPVIALARRRLTDAGLLPRVRLVAGDFYKSPLPSGADLVWVSAIVHQNSRAENRRFFAKIRHALEPGGRVVIRDILMRENRLQPVAGALFAVNMLVATPGGGTFTFAELREDLATAGLVDATVWRQDEGMHSLVAARKPA